MNKKISYILAIAAVLFTAACSDLMDDLNKNVDNPTNVESKFTISDGLVATAFSTVGADYTLYASVFMELNVGIYGQMYNAEIRVSEPINPTTYNNAWNTSYRTLYNFKTVIGKCSDNGVEDGNYLNLGIAQVMTAYNLALLTDVMGDTPWSEALDPVNFKQPKLDKQENIYTAVFQYLDDAIVNLGKTFTFPSLGKQDLIYKGDAQKWIKFAYGLKARYLMRLSKVSPKYDEVITNANQSFANAGEQAKFAYDGSTTTSPFNRFFRDRDYFGASQSLKDKLDARNDPRVNVYFKAHPSAATLVFAPNGSPDQIQKKYGVSALSAPTAPTFLLSYHELEFLKAEAYARKGNTADAETALKKAIAAAFVKVGLTETAADSYYSSDVQALFTANPVSEIMMQKYLACYEEESLEAYNDYRRMKAMGESFITLANPLNSNKFPLRYVYGAEDVVANPNVNAATGDGTYVYTENVWWAGGSR